MPADYYETLGVPKTASADEIRKAYKKLARKYHPDVKPGDKEAESKFKELQEAYDVVGDAEKRKQYDQFGHAFRGGTGPRGGGQTFHWGPGSGPIDLGDLGDLFGGQFDFGNLFGGARGRGGPQVGGRARPQPGADLQLELEVPLPIALLGGARDVRFTKDGKMEQFTVKIPAGVDNGSVIRLAGQGQPGQRGAPPGDLLITLRVLPHAYFRREGNNLLIDVPLTISEATLGTKIEIPTLGEGPVTMTIPPGTSSGTKLRLRGKGGFDRQTKERGDQLVVVKIVVPKTVSPRGRELIQELDRLEPVRPREGLW
jgi:DnaJ-class molecular chaperone